MTPTTGKVGDAVAIVCSGIGSTVTVNFNNTAANPKVTPLTGGQSRIDVTVPAGATTGAVSVYDAASQTTLNAGTFTVTTVTPTPTGALTLVKAMLEDTNSNNLVDQGDTLTLTFSGSVTVTATDPAGQIDLLVAGDSFGTGATLAAGKNATDVVVILGANPHVKVTGTYSATATGSYLASGVDIDAAASGIVDSTGKAPAPVGGVDVGSASFVEGCYLGPSLVYSRGLHTATLIAGTGTAADGTVLVTGGVTATGPGTSNYQRENEVFDPVANVFTRLSDPLLASPSPYMTHVGQAGNTFKIGRYAHTATLLSNGQVLIAGGHGFEDEDATGQPIYSELASCFLYDPTTYAFTETGALATARRDHDAVLLATGQVMVFGGRDVNGTVASSELYDPVAGTWSAGPSMQVGRYDAAVIPYTGGVFVAGGATQTGRTTANPVLNNVTSDESFDPSVPAFSLAGSLNTERREPAGVLMDTNDLLVFGGADGNNASLTSIEMYDPGLGLWTPVGDLAAARQRCVSGRIDGDALAIGGMTTDAAGNVTTVDTVETLNESGAVASFKLQLSRLSHTVTSLNDGRVLILGGFRNPSTDIRGLDGTSNQTGEYYVRP
jgi:hypothetical protein